MSVAEGYQSIWTLNVLTNVNKPLVSLTLWLMHTWQGGSVPIPVPAEEEWV